MPRLSLEQAYTHIREAEIVDLASQLISTESVTGNERSVILLAKKLLDERGVETRLYGSGDRPVLTGTINPDAKRQLAFNGHLDTVPPASLDAWATPPFKPQRIRDSLTGRGSLDMKSSCAVMIATLGILSEAGVPMGVSVHLVPDEEKGAAHGTRVVMREMEAGQIRRPDWCIVGEKSDLKLRVAERGGFSFKIRFSGVAAHTAFAREGGVNAIAKASKGVLALEKPIDKWHPWIGAPVISVNSVTGGTAGNQVPDECVISVDRRVIPGENPDTVLAEVKAALDEAGKGDPDFRYEIQPNRSERGEIAWSPANYTEPDSPLGLALADAYRDAVGKEPELMVGWAGGTDGALYRRAGIPTIGFGPSGERMHGPNELVYVSTLITQARVYLALAYRLSDC